jgi:hypothetical protein
MKLDLTKKIGKNQLQDFCDTVESLSRKIGFKVSSRGWGYIMEQEGWITKDQFDKIEDIINRARKNGMLPVDFVAEESARAFSEIHVPSESSYEEHIISWLEAALESDRYFTPDWWDDEEYYIQMVVEKIDLVTLFQPICRDYHIPIGNSKGWSSILQRADYSRRFKQAQDKGLKCVLLYCGDHDPDGLRISDTLRKNLEDVKDVQWSDGEMGYDPEDLEIFRFGLDYQFIVKNKLTWIDNLITGSGKDLNSPQHPNFHLPYLKEYKKKVGVRKCEANSVVIIPELGRKLCEDAIIKYLGDDAKRRFQRKRQRVRDQIIEIMDEVEVKEPIEAAIKKLNDR